PRIACLCSGLLSRRLMSLLLFFFSHSCSLRVLHSFPTRRSSDLDGFVSALDVDAVAVLLMTVPLGMVPSGCTLIVNCALPLLAVERKSTRLNSSHVEITDAVFCWKKERAVDDASYQAELEHIDYK